MARTTKSDGLRTTAVRHGKLRRSSSWRNLGRVLITTALVVAFSGAATAAFAVWGLVSNLKTVDLGSKEPLDAVGAGSTTIDGALTVFLAGSDTREGQAYQDGEESELNDVNLLLHVSADHQNATVISFPRDLMLPIPSCPSEDGVEDFYPAMSEQQLNSAMMYGGLPCVVRTIEELTGTNIDYAGLITFDGVIGISEAIGGVDVCLTDPIVDPNTDLNLPAGINTLVGNEALQFLRTRYGVGDGSDTSRINNQQVFMSSLVRKLKSAETLSDPIKVYSLAKAGIDNMYLSKSMASIQFMQAAAGTVKDIDLDRIQFIQYPSATHPYQEGRLRPNYELGQILMDTVLSGQPFDVTGVGEGIEVETPPTDGTETPADGTEAPVEGGDGSETPTDAPTDGGPIALPSEITGLKSSTQSCSQGRTVY